MSVDAIIDSGFKVVADLAETFVFFSVPLSFDGPDGVEVVKKVPLVVVWLAAAALFFTVYLRFFNLRHFKHAFDCLTHKYDEPDAKGQISNFDSLAACLSATIGLGNIAGVAVAVTVGGPGAAFWMGVMGLLGMGSKFAEVTLGVKYRHFPDTDRPDEVAGGPMYYLRDGFEKFGMKKIGIVVAAFFALCCVGGAIGAGNMFQANQVYQQALYVTGGESSFLYEKGWLFGLVLAALAGAVTLGGVNSIAKVAARLTPIMALLYIVAGFAVLAVNYQNVPGAIEQIFSSAFSVEAGWGGLIGAIIAGVQRAAFANEAGIGTAAIIQASAKTDFPVRQGIVGGLGPFLDTFFVCMVTALVIIVSGVYQGGEGVQGIDLTSKAFETVFPWFDIVLSVVVFLFAYSTIIVYSYYGEKCLGYLIGDRKSTAMAFRVVYLLFIVIGTASSLGNVVRFADAMFLSMAIPNIIGLYLFAPELKRDVEEYLVLMGLGSGKLQKNQTQA
jgi:AGCS family alanine or glycine:cation symporter